ncbi:hypothetical protein A6R70_01885 [Agrobacterium rubi]|nr:hypothetical protein [Agrobacterium rubi]
MITDYRHHNFDAAIEHADNLTLYIREFPRFLTLYRHSALLLERMARGKYTDILLACDDDAERVANSNFCGDAETLSFSPKAHFNVVECNGIAPAFILIADDVAFVSTFTIIPAMHRGGTHFASVWTRSDDAPSLGYKTVRMMLNAKLAKPTRVMAKAHPDKIFIGKSRAP